MNHSFNLFDNTTNFDRIALPDADVQFMLGFYRAPQTAQYLDALLAEIAWRQETIILWGQEHLQPRLSAWYGDRGKAYTYSGKTFQASPWTETLLRIRSDIEQATQHRFNSVLLNLYRDENDSVGWHSDAEQELGEQPVIASLSLGETRVFQLRHKTRKDLKTLKLELSDGSLLLMAGTTQRHWQHAVLKERSARWPRINLTFRTILGAT